MREIEFYIVSVITTGSIINRVLQEIVYRKEIEYLAYSTLERLKSPGTYECRENRVHKKVKSINLLEEPKIEPFTCYVFSNVWGQGKCRPIRVHLSNTFYHTSSLPRTLHLFTLYGKRSRIMMIYFTSLLSFLGHS